MFEDLCVSRVERVPTKLLPERSTMYKDQGEIQGKFLESFERGTIVVVRIQIDRRVIQNSKILNTLYFRG